MIETQMRQGVTRMRCAHRRRNALSASRMGTSASRALLFSETARPLRFALTGGLAGLLQLGLLALLTGRGWPATPANAVAFLLSAQVNFALSVVFTWRDRGTGAALWRRWLMFHASIAAMAVVNQLVFLAARTALPTLAAAAAGIAVAALGNFLLGDRLVFRHMTETRVGDTPGMIAPQEDDKNARSGPIERAGEGGGPTPGSPREIHRWTS